MTWSAGPGGLGLAPERLFSGAETGFYRATRLRLVLDAMGGDALARGLVCSSNHPSLFVATALVGNSLANYCVSLGAWSWLPTRCFPRQAARGRVGWPRCCWRPVLFVYGELLPKNLFLQAPNRLLRRGGPLLLVFVVLLLPVSALVVGLEPAAWRAAGAHAVEPVRTDSRPPRAAPRSGRRTRGGHPAPGPARPGPGDFRRRRPARRAISCATGRIARAQAGMNKQAVLALAEQHRAPVIPVESPPPAGELIGYVRVIDLKLSAGQDLRPLRPLLEIRETARTWRR